MLEKMYYGNSLQDWGLSLLYVAGGFVLCQLLWLLNREVVRRLVRKSKIKYDGLFFSALEKPVMFGVMLAAVWMACERLHWEQQTHGVIATAYRILAALNVTWFVARLAVAIVEESLFPDRGMGKGEQGFLNQRLFPLVRRLLLICIWVVGGMTALSEAGVGVMSLWGPLGIGGIALALAAQDTVKNMLGGVTIFIDRSFRIGDIIRFDSVEGTIEDIGLRSTRIRTYDRQLVVIPNYRITDAVVTNVTSEPARRMVVTLWLTYDTRYEQMQEALALLRQIPRTVPEVSRDDLVASFSGYGDSALQITFVYFIRKTADIRETGSRVNFEILRTFGDAGLNFAFPTQTVYLEGNKG